ncbi:hypothetical protein [Rufibacter immobilis]|uniref:hypothetical protein n=1 Tax=Rufibacter immobilis TaxID=1348778 RepID=UPI0035EB1281
MKLPKVLSLLFAFSLLVLGSCSEDDESTPVPGQQTCRPVKVTSEGLVSNITYTNDKITNFSTEGYGNATVSYHSAGNLAGKVASMAFSGGEQGNGTLEYEYDDQGLLIGTFLTILDLGGAGQVAEFTYTNGRISKITRTMVFSSEDEGEGPFMISMGHTTYTYDSQGNVLKATDYDADSETPDHTIEYTYDTKSNPSAGIEAFMVGLPGMNPASGNNILTAIYKEGNTVDKDNSYSNAYVFNSSGYATKITSTTQNGEVTVTNIDYSCN